MKVTRLGPPRIRQDTIRVGDTVFSEADIGAAAHIADAIDAHDASAISFVPTGTIAATDVQAAIAEVAAEAGVAGSAVGISFIIDGGEAVITTGIKGYVEVPFACTITAARLFADQSGSIVVDVWKDTYANFPPVDADSITAAAPPTISAATKSEDTTLTGWTTAVAAGDILGFNVDSAATVERVTLALTVTRT